MATTEKLQLDHELVLTAVKNLLGPKVILVDIRTTPATQQGLSSLILKVIPRVVKENGNEEEIYLVAKVLPTDVPAQALKCTQGDLLGREGTVLLKAAPLLRANCSIVPLVNCLAASSTGLILEDLNRSEFHTTGRLDLPHINLIVRGLAHLHAASVGVDWVSTLPHLRKDATFEASGKALLFSFTRACEAYANLLQELDPESFVKDSQFLHHPEHIFKHLIKLSKTTPGEALNVLCHGDCWTNNILFKYQNGEPKDVKFIDLPLARCVPPSRDLQHVLYTCTTREFRAENERQLLKEYYKNFQTCLRERSSTLIPPFSEEELWKEYNENRIWGASLALVFRTLGILTAPVLNLMTEEKFKELSAGDHLRMLLPVCKADPDGRGQELQGILQDFLVAAHTL